MPMPTSNRTMMIPWIYWSCRIHERSFNKREVVIFASPLAAYDATSDSVLILDTARFKYGAHWVPLPLIFDAMRPIDPDTGKSRGYALLSFVPHTTPASSTDATVIKTSTSTTTNHVSTTLMDTVAQPMSLLFRSKMSQQFIRRTYKEYLSSLDGPITWDQVVMFWTKNGDDPVHVWNLIEPLRLPKNSIDAKRARRVRELMQQWIPTITTTTISTAGQTTKTSGDHCCGHDSVCMAPQEAVFIVYLASLGKDLRKNILDSSKCPDCDLAREQVLVEAELIAAAIEMSDQTTTF